MSDDKHLSRLISQSIRTKLANEETTQVEKHVAENPEAKKFAELSRHIQNSVAGLKVDAESNDDENLKLSAVSRKRLMESVSLAIQEKASMSHAGLIEERSPMKTKIDASVADFPKDADTASEPDHSTVCQFHRIRRIGIGGLGEVWLARDNKLRRNVAVKELNAEARENPQAWRRFHREAEITGHLEHPNIVPLYVFGNDRETAEPFYAMRFVGKRTLLNAVEEYHDRVEAGEVNSLGLHRLLNIFLDVCHAIAYAHSRGVIHRDLKPENIAIDNFGQVVVLDWGLAKVFEESELALKVNNSELFSDSALMQTLSGEVVGTPSYMSPEQAAGQLELVDAKTDIYGLGGILFSILTGEAPHLKTLTKSAANISKALKQISTSETPRPSEVGKNVPDVLERICTKSMAVKRHLRFDSVEDLAEEVETWIAGQSSKQSEYETLRMEGRELRADIQARARDLNRNVRFCVGLPPIDALVSATSEDDTAIWRKRLSSILTGLLSANPDYRHIIFAKADESSFEEIVRVETDRQGDQRARSVPKSRLASGELTDFLKSVLQCKPGQIYTTQENGKGQSTIVETSSFHDSMPSEEILLAGIPVYDSDSEEVYGFLLIGYDIGEIIREQLSWRNSASEMIVASNDLRIVSRTVDGKLIEESFLKSVTEVSPHFSKATEKLQTSLDYNDTDYKIFGAQFWLTPGDHGIVYLLKRS